MAPSCRSCHETRDASRLPNLDFRTFPGFASWVPPAETDLFSTNNIFSLGHPGGPYIVPPNSPITMPHARRTFQRFWSSLAPPQPDVFLTALSGSLDYVSFAPPIMQNPQPMGSDVIISFVTQLGGGYTVQRASNLTNPEWESLPGIIAGDGGITQVIEPIATSQASFYRVIVAAP